MSRAEPLSVIRELLMAGAKSAFEQYERISGGEWLSWAPESFLQACLFQELGEVFAGQATLEESPRKIRYRGGKTPDNRTARTNKNERFDIVVWFADGRPRCIVEVKKIGADLTSIVEDADRIRRWIGTDEGCVQAGYLVVYSEAKAEETLKGRFEQLRKDVAGICRDPRDIHVGPEPDYQGWYWAVAVVEIR